MIRICMRCHKVMGEKEPFEDKSETHGYCDPCLKIELRKIRRIQKKMRKEGWKAYGTTQQP